MLRCLTELLRSGEERGQSTQEGTIESGDDDVDDDGGEAWSLHVLQPVAVSSKQLPAFLPFYQSPSEALWVARHLSCVWKDTRE